MSQVTKLSMPSASIRCAAAEMPAAGPDSTVRTGTARTSGSDIRPPFDAIV